MPPNQGEDVLYQVTDVSSPLLSGTWERIEGRLFVYRDDRTVPPDLLRDTPEQNYLSQGLRVFGLTLMSFAMFLAVVCFLWIYWKREHHVLRASQPHFLYVICFGAFAQAWAIFTISFDESEGWTPSQLSKACMATPWLVSLGHIIVHGTLFAKMWRVHKVLRFARHRIKTQSVAWPVLLLFASTILVLALWTGLDGIEWEREVIEPLTGETIGKCDSDHVAAWLVPLSVLMATATALSGLLAWATRDVDEKYTESWWIFILILVQLEVFAVAAPIVVLLQDVSTDGRYDIKKEDRFVLLFRSAQHSSQLVFFVA
jgi:gamma-aminobutyric acid type B receptor